ncbi:2-phospho-L-lactate transferase [Croceicoccus sp. Ery5]|uniref:2-phospho-L-lactate transferase n=1 Tax=Croceicoccus sp. Ery5 TaxID=1703340 RepID=UPI001E5B911F|nr:2-phospho-L-lactate transferase [Croceicoccus sp. Ery5]
MSARVTVLTGGVGGAKLVEGLQQIVPGTHLTAIVNTGDDFEHFGLPISPDIDTLLYTLAGLSNARLGWGREGETWSFMDAVKSLGGEDWFNLGDGDLALHVLRRMARDAGQPLSEIVRGFALQWGLGLTILPMSDDPVATWLQTDEGLLPFQRYFVARRCEPRVNAIRFEGADAALPAPGVVAAIEAADMILIAPSNPWLSIDPILAVPGLRQALERRNAPLVAVSPLVGGKAVKGPTAKLMDEMGLSVTNQTIAEHYGDLLDAMLVHQGDPHPSDPPCAETDTLMNSAQDRHLVAVAAMDLAERSSR